MQIEITDENTATIIMTGAQIEYKRRLNRPTLNHPLVDSRHLNASRAAKWIDKQLRVQMDKRTGRRTNGQMDGPAEGRTGRRTDVQNGRAEGQMDRRADGQAE